MPIFHRRLKSPILDSLDGLFIEPHAQAGLHVNIARPPIHSHNKGQRADALILRLPGFFGELGLRLINRTRRRNAGTPAEDTSAGTAAFSRTKSRPFAFSNATAFAFTNAAARSSSVGRQHRMGHRVAQGRHVVRSEMKL